MRKLFLCDDIFFQYFSKKSMNIDIIYTKYMIEQKKKIEIEGLINTFIFRGDFSWEAVLNLNIWNICAN